MKFISTISLLLLLSGCSIPDGQPLNTGDTQNQSTSEPVGSVSIKHPDLWSAVENFHSIAGSATTIDDILPLMTESLRSEFMEYDVDLQAIAFDILSLSEKDTSIEYLNSFVLEDFGVVYVKYSGIPEEEGPISVAMDMRYEDGEWRYDGSGYNDDDYIESMWEPGFIENIMTSGSGRINYDGMTMPVYSALAFLDKDNQEITILLYPFDLTPDDIWEHRSGYLTNNLFDKPSPNTDLWPDWAPMAMFNLYYDDTSETYNITNISNFCINLNWFEEPNSFNFSCDISFVESTTLFELPTSTRSTLRFAFEGQGYDAIYQWNFSGEAELLNIEHVRF